MCRHSYFTSDKPRPKLMEDSMLLYEYTEILCGMRNGFSRVLFNNNPENNQKTALKVVKYALDIFLGCKTPNAAEAILTKDVVKRMKLDKVMCYIHFPEELNKKNDFFYLAHLLYPNVIPYDQKALSLKVYKEILEGRTLHKFPKKYLDGIEGKVRAGYCLAYMISKYFHFQDTEEMYDFFSRTEGTDAIRDYKLKQASLDIFDTPIDYLHYTLPEEQKDPFLFHYYKFRIMNMRTDRKIARREVNIAPFIEKS